MLRTYAENQFKEILRDAGYPELRLTACPNEYGSASYRGPWFLFFYKGEFIRIGWRKRVIEIDWGRVASKQLRELLAKNFANVESTRTDTYVHANDAKEASKFLADIRGYLHAYSIANT